MIFYFTATGNSLYVAKQIEAKPVSIPQVIHQENREFSADSIGIVAPVYGHEMPNMVKDFIRNSVFNTDYFYIILTYGNRHGGAAELAKQFCDECGIKVNYINVVLMVDNWLPSFDMNEQMQIDKKIPEKMAVILSDLNARKNMISEVTDADRDAHRQFLERMGNALPDAWQHLIEVTDDCTGCGICEQVCPSASIRIVDGNAVFLPGKCETCFACIHACPAKAIALTVSEKNPQARFRNENISLQEIIDSNHQTNRRYDNEQ